MAEAKKMASLEEAWKAVAAPRDGELVSPQLRPLVEAVYRQCLHRPVNINQLAASLENLLEFLATDGRTNANCWAVDLFFANCAGWESDWGDCHLPEGLHDVLAMMGEALHDTVKAPSLAENFGCLPEQLLERLRRALGNGDQHDIQ
ncbi:MAG TPA: hypothetical protein VHX36_17620 [Candidatus Acidoferrales bacterium]|jgi:hypothetical protein|nr:hypothetical protein [Candidatus Acidoferrales bacterium]